MPLSFAFIAGGVTASVNQDSLVHDALKPLQLSLLQPQRCAISASRQSMPMAYFNCTLQNLPAHQSTAQHDMQYTLAEKQ
ncbi:hypothetical protein WJX77_011369 [Trebouxia sp. C0004]